MRVRNRTSRTGDDVLFPDWVLCQYFRKTFELAALRHDASELASLSLATAAHVELTRYNGNDRGEPLKLIAIHGLEDRVLRDFTGRLLNCCKADDLDRRCTITGSRKRVGECEGIVGDRDRIVGAGFCGRAFARFVATQATDQNGSSIGSDATAQDDVSRVTESVTANLVLGDKTGRNLDSRTMRRAKEKLQNP